MKKIYFVVIFVLFISFFLTSFCYSAESQKEETSVTVDLTKLSNNTRNEILNLKSKKEGSIEATISSSPEVAKNWINVGKEIGNAVNEMAKALNTNINEFAKTPVGRTAMFLLVYKLIGKDIISKGFCLMIYAFITVLLIWSFRKFHVNERVERSEIDNNDNVVKRVLYIEKYNFYSRDAKTMSAFVHAGLFVGFSILVLIAILH